MLDNFEEVAEPYVFEKKNALTGTEEKISISDNINISNSLSHHLRSYMLQTLKAEDVDELVAVNEPPENNHSGGDDPILEKGTTNKQKRVKEMQKYLKEGELTE